MNVRNHLLSAASASVFIVLFTCGWWFIAGFVPPISPTASPAEVAAAYQENNGLIRFGLMLAVSSVAFIIPMASALAGQMKRMEGTRPVLANAQLACATVTVTMVTVALVLWSVAAFRPERDSELIYLLNDLAWIGFTMPVCGIVVWMLTVGIAVLSDESAVPVFPRWVGYTSLLASMLTVPGFPVVMFDYGPFAWNGLLAFWIALIVAISWMTLMMVLTFQAVRKEGLAAQ